MLFVCTYTIQVQRGLKVISDGWKDESGMVAAKTGLPVMAEPPDCGGAAQYSSLLSFSSITLPPKRPFAGCTEKEQGMMIFISNPARTLRFGGHGM